MSSNRPMPMPMPMPSSPCVGICTLDDSGHCLGCRRHIDEIAAWTRLSAAERQRILEELPQRDVGSDITS